MGKTEDKESKRKKKIISAISQAAIIYKNTMVGRHFLYVFEGRYIEVIYRTKDFMHLTGVGYNSSAKQFYRDAIEGQLVEPQIFFSQRHPYKLCAKKVFKLSKISDVVDSEMFILEDSQTNTFTYKFELTDLEITICLSEDTDKNGNVVGDHYIARSFRVGDEFDRAANAYEVNFIFSKEYGKQKYDTIKYSDKRVSIESLPQNILDMLDNSLRQKD